MTRSTDSGSAEPRSDLMHLRVEPSLNQQLKETARRANATYSGLVRQMCREGLERREVYPANATGSR